MGLELPNFKLSDQKCDVIVIVMSGIRANLGDRHARRRNRNGACQGRIRNEICKFLLGTPHPPPLFKKFEMNSSNFTTFKGVLEWFHAV